MDAVVLQVSCPWFKIFHITCFGISAVCIADFGSVSHLHTKFNGFISITTCIADFGLIGWFHILCTKFNSLIIIAADSTKRGVVSLIEILKFCVPSLGYNLLLIKLIFCGVMPNYVFMLKLVMLENCSAIVCKALFSSQNVLDFATVTLSVLFGNYYSIID